MSGVGKWGQRIGAWEKETGKRMKAGKLDFWLYVSKLGSVPPLRMSLGGVAQPWLHIVGQDIQLAGGEQGASVRTLRPALATQ